MTNANPIDTSVNYNSQNVVANGKKNMSCKFSLNGDIYFVDSTESRENKKSNSKILPKVGFDSRHI